jgi:hypothetical protein
MSPVAREHSFDELTRGMASGSISRGKALRLMGAALVGGTLASLGIGEAAADPPGCKRNGKNCTKDKVCCSGNCVNSTCSACPSDRVLLCNGTCARRCTSFADCGAGCEGCGGEISTGLQFCGRADPAQTRCSTCSDCPTGQFCHAFGTGGICDFAC